MARKKAKETDFIKTVFSIMGSFMMDCIMVPENSVCMIDYIISCPYRQESGKKGNSLKVAFLLIPYAKIYVQLI